MLTPILEHGDHGGGTLRHCQEVEVDPVGGDEEFLIRALVGFRNIVVHGYARASLMLRDRARRY